MSMSRTIRRAITRNVVDAASRRGKLKCPKCGTLMLRKEKSKIVLCPGCRWEGRLK